MHSQLGDSRMVRLKRVLCNPSVNDITYGSCCLVEILGTPTKIARLHELKHVLLVLTAAVSLLFVAFSINRPIIQTQSGQVLHPRRTSQTCLSDAA